MTTPPTPTTSLHGHYAGIATRTTAFTIDITIAATIFAIGGKAFEYLFTALLNHDITLKDARPATIIILTTWLLTYFAYPLAVSGRTLGMALVGLEVRTHHGHHITTTQAILRTLLLPLSITLLTIGILTILINRQNRALHDLIAGTTVVYSWNARAAQLRFLTKPTTQPHPPT